jgi:6-phosphogluconolactonase
VSEPSIVVAHTAEELVSQVAVDFSALVSEILEFKPVANIVLTGGSLGIALIGELAKLNLDLTKLRFMFSDERFVALDHEDRNEHQGISLFPELANKSLLRYPAANSDLLNGQSLMNKAMTISYGSAGETSEVFDLVILGLGPDGHVASLFPGHQSNGEWIMAERASPKPPSERLSLSYGALNRANQVWFLASGAQKAAVVSSALNDVDCELPLAKVKGLQSTSWYLDKELSDAL